jgi:hypothetical protein
MGKRVGSMPMSSEHQWDNMTFNGRTVTGKTKAIGALLESPLRH